MKEFYRRHLPHYQPQYATFFITFRLVNSLPRHIIEQLKDEYSTQKELRRLKRTNPKTNNVPDTFYKHYFAAFDEFLDKQKERNCWLKDKSVAQAVVNAIHYRDGKEYDLICYTVMPNHVHMVFTADRSGPSTCKSVTKILQPLKSYTAIKANDLLHRTGTFWQGESFDHVVKDEKELERITSYVLNNPVRAGLVKNAKEWKFSYCKYGW
ncbi:MAG: transposase [Bacteroidota bacterium]|nr:transposase [Bacteroidota bacterium]